MTSAAHRGTVAPRSDRGGQKEPWNPHWQRLLTLLKQAVPAHWTVLVLSDRGLESPALFQMIQQLRRANAEAATPPIGGGPPGNYDDMAATKRTQAEREEAYVRELQDLYQRHRDLEQQKQPILDNLRRRYPPPPGAPGG